jgi:hypothetical protein
MPVIFVNPCRVDAHFGAWSSLLRKELRYLNWSVSAVDLYRAIRPRVAFHVLCILEIELQAEFVQSRLPLDVGGLDTLLVR